MQYKTIVLELIWQQTELYEELRTTRRLLPMMERWASELKAKHEVWKEALWLLKPGSQPSQITSEALEMAVHEMENRLRTAPGPSSGPGMDEPEALSLDKAMAYVRSRSLNA